nr:ROK family protein [Chloroflexota bacterium]
MRRFVVGVDLGGTQIRAVLADEKGTVLKRVSTLTQAHEGAHRVMSRLVDCIGQALQEVERSQVLGIGVATAGAVNPCTGVIAKAANLPGFENWPLRDMLAQELHVPIYVGNDAKLAALAEHRFGAGQGTNFLIYLTISTGIGAGVIEDRRLLLGAHGWATELGHIIVEPNGPRCNCGNIGCLEALASGPAIARHAMQLLQEGESSLLWEMVRDETARITAKEVVEAAQKGDALALQVMQRAAFYLGIGLVSFIHAFDPECIIVGGGVSKAGELLFAPMRAVIAERVIAAAQRDIRIVPAALGDDAGLIGALALVLADVGAA